MSNVFPVLQPMIGGWLINITTKRKKYYNNFVSFEVYDFDQTGVNFHGTSCPVTALQSINHSSLVILIFVASSPFFILSIFDVPKTGIIPDG